MAKLEIRPLRPEEVEEVVRLWRRSREDAQPWLEARMQHTPADDLAFFRGTIMRENEIRVAAENGAPVGFMAIAGGHLNYLYVDPPKQGQGIGTMLLDEARAMAPHGLTLFTHQRNAKARAFYERRSFRVIELGVSPAPESEPDVKYEWLPG
jgi:ribosomal protein S18 acetylase RimI-like enzyme